MLLDKGVKLNLQFFADEDDDEGFDEGSANQDQQDDFDDEGLEIDDTDYEESEDVEGTNEEPNEEPEIDESTSRQQSKDKKHPANKAFADMRRKIKEEERRVREKELEIEQINREFQTIGQKYGVQVNNAREYAELMRKQESEQESRKMREQWEETQDPAILAKMVEKQLLTSPEVQQLNQQVRSMREEMAKRQYEEAMQAQIKEFNSSYNGNLTSIDDVLTLPNYQKVIGYMQKGLTISDAHLLANKGILIEKQKQAVRQQVVNQTKGFSHVGTPKGNTTIQDKNFTEEDIKVFQAFYPNLSRKEIIKRMSENS